MISSPRLVIVSTSTIGLLVVLGRHLESDARAEDEALETEAPEAETLLLPSALRELLNHSVVVRNVSGVHFAQ